MSKREWGEGIVELTECYFKYCEMYVVQKGYIYQKPPQKIQYMTAAGEPMEVTYATDVDIIGVKLSTKEALLVECTEDADNAKAKELLDRFRTHETTELFKDMSKSGLKIRKYIACAKAGYGVEALLSNEGVTLLTAKTMALKLLDHRDEKFRHDPILWMLRTLSNDGLIKT